MDNKIRFSSEAAALEFFVVLGGGSGAVDVMPAGRLFNPLTMLMLRSTRGTSSLRVAAGFAGALDS